MHFKFSYFILAAIISGLIFSCSQTKIKPKAINVPPEKTVLAPKSKSKLNPEPNNDELQLTFHGENSQASFSPNENKIIYISKNQYQHINSQVYELNLDTLESTRITYQDGENASPIYSNGGTSIIFASTTDEIKENPLFLYNRLQAMKAQTDRGIAATAIHNGSDLQPFELYKKFILIDDIVRLTKTPFLDKNMSNYRYNGRRIFTSARDGNLEIYSYRPSLPDSPIRLTFNDLTDDEAQFSPTSNEFIWTRFGINSKYSQILWRDSSHKITHELSFGEYSHINPKWHPNGEYIYFSATGKDHKNYQIYTMKKNGECKTRISNSSFSDKEPSIAPNAENIIFTRNKNLFKMKLKEPKC